MPVRIGLDARCLTMPRLRGIGRSLRDLYRELTARRPHDQFLLYHQRPLNAGRPDDADLWARPNVRPRHIDLPGDRFDAWLHLRLPLAAGRDRVDLLHCPAGAVPFWSPAPVVATIHDLIPLRLPGEWSAGATRALRRTARRAVRKTRHLIAISNATREDLVDLCDAAPEHITVIPWAADTRIVRAAQGKFPEEDRREIRRRYELAERWLIAFAGTAPRKNATGILAALAALPPPIRDEQHVVLLGCSSQGQRDALAAEAERLGVIRQVRILDFVPHDELPDLLCGACGLLMPSRYEGFGLPILDAFACGVPVLTSPVSSMPEIAGDAAVYCDPNDPRSIAAGMQRLLDGATADRLVSMGYQRLALFTWERTAAMTWTVFERCLTAAAEAPRAVPQRPPARAAETVRS